MALIYPPEIYSGTKSPGETAVFNQIRDDPTTRNWCILHSLDIADHVRQVTGESDFVFIIPRKGILCLEVKASRRIRVENGVWYYGSDPIGDPRSPFKQAKEAAFSILKRLKKDLSIKMDFPVWGAVLFPYCQFQTKSIEWHEWESADMEEFKSLGTAEIVLRFLDAVSEYLQSKPDQLWFDPEMRNLSESTCRLIAHILRPNFEYNTRLSRADDFEYERRQYTADQFGALDAMRNNKKVIFEGPAGTGKTLLAVESARRSVSKGNKVLFVCFNRLLADWLMKETTGLEGVRADSLHRMLLRSSGISVPSEFPNNFWDEVLPDEAIENILEMENPVTFDELIVDEAQDIVWNERYLDYLDLCLKGGLKSGSWRFFGDFEKQSIFLDNQYFDPTNLDLRTAGVPIYSLRVNCRNTPRIAEYIRLLGGLDPNYSSVRRPDSGIRPEIVFYNLEIEQERMLKQAVQRLMEEKWTAEDIVVLSMTSASKSTAAKIQKQFARLAPMDGRVQKNKVRFGSVYTFKGLEAPAVVLTDVNELRTDESEKVFYTGISRALDRLVILANNAVKVDILNKVIAE